MYVTTKSNTTHTKVYITFKTMYKYVENETVQITLHFKVNLPVFYVPDDTRKLK